MSASSHAPAPANSNRWDTKTLVTMALFSAVGVLLSYIEIPVFAPAPYLKFDPSFITAMIGGFLYGPVAGIVIGLVQNIIHGVFSTGGGFFGALMNCAIVVAYVWPASMIYKHRRTFGTAIVALVAGIVCGVAVALLMNIWVTPLYTTGVSTQAVIVLIVPVLLPFNLIKMGIDSVLTLLVYKPISNMVTPRKERKTRRSASSDPDDAQRGTPGGVAAKDTADVRDAG